jgi:hypothetical protein
MKLFSKSAILAIAAIGVATCAFGQSGETRAKGTAVAYPFAFEKGTNTARNTAYEAAAGIARKAGYASAPKHVAEQAWEKLGIRDPKPSKMPSTANLTKFGRETRASVVLYGSVKWHTRSIWVGAGPKTISTATVSVYVFDVQAGKVVFSKTKVEGRSDEKENGYKVAAAILLTPVVTVVSGGPKTPQEQRAVQIALARAFYDWAKK